MTDRTVSVRLRLEMAGYVAGLKQAGVATRSLAMETKQAALANQKATQDIGRAATIAGAVVAAGLGLAAAKFANFDKAMSGVRAATHETAANMDLLREAALQAGADTAFSATEAASAVEALAKAGVSTVDVLGGGLTGALDLAAAGQLEVGQAAEIAATAMTQFGLAGKDIPHIADLLAAGAGKAQGEVSDMAAALKYAGVPAAELGVSIEETAGTIALFAKNGIVGEQAGTSLRSMIASLTAPSTQAASVMAELGVSVFDAQGNFVGLDGVAGQLNEKLAHGTDAARSQALGIIFGNEAMQAATVLTREGAAGVEDWTRKVNDQGFAAETAAIKLDNLRGDIEKFTGSLETALIGSGSGANGALRELTQGATGAVNAFSGLPQPVQQSATGLAAIGGSALLAVGAFGTLAPRVRETRTSLESMGRAGIAANKSLGLLGKVGGYGAIAATAALGFAALSNEIYKLTGNAPGEVTRLANSLVHLSEGGKAGGEAARLFGADLSGLNSAVAQASRPLADLQTGFGLLPSRIDVARDKLDAIDQALTSLVTSGNAAEAQRQFDLLASKLPADKVAFFRDALDGYETSLKGADTQASLATGSASDLADAYAQQVSPAAKDAAEAMKAYTDALEDTAAIDAYTATAQLSQSFRELSKEIKTAGRVTDGEKISLGGFASDVRSTSSAILEQTGSQKKANAAMRAGRAQFIDLAVQAGYTRAEAKKLANTLLDIPARTDVNIVTHGLDPAIAKIAELRRQAGIPIEVTVNTINRLNTVPGGPRVGRGEASGGHIRGAGTSTSDSIPAWLSDGEFVVRASAVKRYGAGMFHALNAEHLAGGGLAGDMGHEYALAAGGPVKRHAGMGRVRLTFPSEGAA